MARDLADARLGLPWSAAHPGSRRRSTVAHTAACKDYWVYQSRRILSGWVRDDYGFEIPGRDHPTLERIRYSLLRPSAGEPGFWRRVRAALVDSLGVQADSFGWQAWDPVLVDFRTDGSVFIEPFRGREVSGVDSITVEYRSYWLEEQMDPDEWNLAEMERAEKAKGRAREVLAALRTHDSRLAAALESTHATSSQIRTVREELRIALQLPPGDADRDLVLLATHLWTRQFAEGLTKGRCADTDSTVLHNFNAAFSSFGGSLDCGYDDIWCFPGFLADSLASRAGANRWTDFAFLERMEEGWSPQCDLCGYDSIVGTDQFRPVIARGMSYLKAHPSSPIAAEIRLMVAEAHETAWSNAVEGNEYVESRYEPAIAGHRRRAMTMYQSYLEERPRDPRDGAIRLRLGRMRLGKPTYYYRYWCMWD